MPLQKWFSFLPAEAVDLLLPFLFSLSPNLASSYPLDKQAMLQITIYFDKSEFSIWNKELVPLFTKYIHCLYNHNTHVLQIYVYFQVYHDAEDNNWYINHRFCKLAHVFFYFTSLCLKIYLKSFQYRLKFKKIFEIKTWEIKEHKQEQTCLLLNLFYSLSQQGKQQRDLPYCAMSKFSVIWIEYMTFLFLCTDSIFST